MPHTLIEYLMSAAKSLKQRETNAHLVVGGSASFSTEWKCVLGKKGVAKFGPDSAAREGESKRVSLPQWATLRHNSFKVGQVCQGG